ncbi:MAG: NAD-dependent epimerase/dehydratase family protein [Candidatus Hydrogenedentes bacterium]|jgi:UDP-glucose 4-epimerase|nr:NAD-dependent epimerase/dehydratase family protein [Candidatus Hydrogenedentota bacterium]
MAKHTILVTGGAGFIGSHVVDAYINKGHTVVVVDDLSSGNEDFVHESAIFYGLDLRSQQLEEVFQEHAIDIVSHHAAQIDVRRSVDDALYDSDVNVRGTINLLDLCVRHKIKKVIFSSTGGAIYGSPTTLPADEETPPQPGSPYGTSKLCAEQYIRLYERIYKLGFTILRYPNVYGPRQNPYGEAGVCSIFAGTMLAGETPTLYGQGKAFRDYVYVSDIAAANVLALEKANGKILNLGSGKGTTVRELFTIIAKLTGFSGKPLLKALRLGEVEGIYITGQRAFDELGWQPEITLKEGLTRTVDYIKEQGMPKQKPVID